MTLKPPSFWYSKKGRTHLVATALKPAAMLYNFLGQKRIQSRHFFKASGPVICIGNISVGGVGKTPFAEMLAQELIDKKNLPHFLSRGYGGKEKGPIQVDTHQHTAHDVGDEPLLLARLAPTWVSKNKPNGAQSAFANGAEILLMDDGFQNPSLYKDFSFLLVDSQIGFGNGLIFPAGPLRERPQDALARASSVVFIKPDANSKIPKDLHIWAEGREIFECWLSALPLLVPEKVIAFSGIGRPEKFFHTAKETGYEVIETAAFADHHFFTDDEISSLKAKAQKYDCALLTTSKDFARLPEHHREGIKTLDVKMQINDAPRLHYLLSHVLDEIDKQA